MEATRPLNILLVDDQIVIHEQARKALERSKAAIENERSNFRNLFAQSPEMVCILRGPEHVFEFVNEAHVKVLGFDATGISVRMAQPESVQVLGILDEVYRSGRTALLREIAVTVGDRLRYFNLTYSARRDDAGYINGVMMLGVEVTEQVQTRVRTQFLAEASTALASSLGYRETLGDLARLSVPSFADWCSVTIVHGDGSRERIALAHRDPAKNPLAEELLRRYPATRDDSNGLGQVIKTGKSQLVPRVEDSELVKAAQDGRHLEIMRALGCRSCMVVPILSRGKALGALSFVSNRADRIYTESDLSLAEELGRRAGIAIDNAFLYEAANKAVQTRDMFMSIASHELKTPITSLQLHLQMVRKLTKPEQGLAPAPDKLAKLMDNSLTQITRLTALVDDLLDVSRIQAGKLSFNFEEIDVSALVREMTDRYREQLRLAGCSVTLQAPEPVPARADRFRLEQVVINLLSNAAKYGSGMPIEVSVRSGEDGGAIISCRDHGMGIAKEKQSLVFERFERAVTSNSIGGLGLGLYISREIIRAHHGSIRVESEPGQGACFIVQLPSPVSAGLFFGGGDGGRFREESSLTRRHPMVEAPDAVVLRKSVLVVEDDPYIREAILELLEIEGYVATGAANGQIALDALRAAGELPGLVLLDLMMPVKDGFAFREEQNRDDRLRRIPVLVMSADGNVAEKMKLAQAASFLRKPIELDQLLAVVRRYCAS